VKNAESARSSTSPPPCGPPAPAARAATRASLTSRAAPRALLTEPLRSRVAVITGALSGVLAVAISALRPFTPE